MRGGLDFPGGRERKDAALRTTGKLAPRCGRDSRAAFTFSALGTDGIPPPCSLSAEALTTRRLLFDALVAANCAGLSDKGAVRCNK